MEQLQHPVELFRIKTVAPTLYVELTFECRRETRNRKSAMPRFYFDVFDGSRTALDNHGDDWIDVPSAAGQAEELVTDLAREIIPKGRGDSFGVIVRDEQGRDVYRAGLLFRDTYLDQHQDSGHQGDALALTAADPIDLIRRSRETRAETGALSRRVQGTMADLAESLRQVAETMMLAKATLSISR